MIEELAGKGDSGECQGGLQHDRARSWQGRETVVSVGEGYSMIEELAGKGDSGECPGGLQHDRGVGREGRQW